MLSGSAERRIVHQSSTFVGVKGSVMVVEDDDRIRETLRDLLQMEGYSVTTASNGQEALDQLCGARPDLILLDMLMPTMNGVEFLATVRLDGELSKIPVTVLSASRLEACVEPWLRKPFDLDELLAHVRKFCG